MPGRSDGRGCPGGSGGSGVPGGSEPPAERTEGRRSRRSGEGSRHRGRLWARRRPGCRQSSVRPGQRCLPRRPAPRHGLSPSPPGCVPRVNTQGEGSLHFSSSRQPVNRLPPFPSPPAPSPASRPGSAREPLLPRLSDTSVTRAPLFVCLFRFSSQHPLSMPLVPSLPCAASPQHGTGGALPL